MIIRCLFLVALVTLACSTAENVKNAAITAVIFTPQPATTETPEGGEPGSALTPTETATQAFGCVNAPKMRVKVGDSARVAASQGPALRLRRDPAIANDNILKLLSKGTILEIIDGPLCVTDPNSGDEFVFWKVSIPGNPLQGWVAEGDAQNYYIEPPP
jgi:hypothetical protein